MNINRHKSIARATVDISCEFYSTRCANRKRPEKSLCVCCLRHCKHQVVKPNYNKNWNKSRAQRRRLIRNKWLDKSLLNGNYCTETTFNFLFNLSANNVDNTMCTALHWTRCIVTMNDVEVTQCQTNSTAQNRCHQTESIYCLFDERPTVDILLNALFEWHCLAIMTDSVAARFSFLNCHFGGPIEIIYLRGTQHVRLFRRNSKFDFPLEYMFHEYFIHFIVLDLTKQLATLIGRQVTGNLVKIWMRNEILGQTNSVLNADAC